MNDTKLTDLLTLAKFTDDWGLAVKGKVSTLAFVGILGRKVIMDRIQPQSVYTALDESAYQVVKNGKSTKPHSEQVEAIRKALKNRDTNTKIIGIFNRASFAVHDFGDKKYSHEELSTLQATAERENLRGLGSLVKAVMKLS